MGTTKRTLLTLGMLLQVFLCSGVLAADFPVNTSDTIAVTSPAETETPDSLILRENAESMKAISTVVDTIDLVLSSDALPKDAALPVKEQFVPNPNRALWLSLVFPGAGQIYNRKYWKLPIFYGGFMGCAYALTWNQQMYMDYSQAYLDIMDDDPNTKSYEEMLPPRYNIAGREEQFKKIFKRKKDYFRRYRDMSAFAFGAVYLLSVIDAYVDAHLSEFDITPELSMRLQPAVIENNGSLQRKCSYGIGCSLNF